MSSVFDKFGPRSRTAVPPQEAQEAPAPVSTAVSQSSYQAVVLDPQNRRSPARLRIIYGDGMTSLMSYAFLTEVLCTSHEFVSLIFSHCVITLEGRNLEAVVDVLQEDKAKALVCFHPKRFQEPEIGEPLITRIKRESRAAAPKGEGDAARQRQPAQATTR